MAKAKLFKCPLATCNYETAVGRAIGGHIAGHIAHGELAKGTKAIKRPIEEATKPRPLPQLQKQEESILFTPEQVADGLLKKVVAAISREELLDSQLKVAQSKIVDLEQQLDNKTAELNRVIKIHNDQAKRGDFTTSEELIRLARQKPGNRY